MIQCQKNCAWSIRGLVGVLTLVGLTSLLGCGGSESNSKLTRVGASGKVDYDGKPIPAGTVTFFHAASGAGANCVISEGAYSCNSGEGPIVGENSVSVVGYDKLGGTLLWEGTWSNKVTIEASGYSGDFSVKADEIVASQPDVSRVDD